jgi:hypothetical protein
VAGVLNCDYSEYILVEEIPFSFQFSELTQILISVFYQIEKVIPSYAY